MRFLQYTSDASDDADTDIDVIRMGAYGDPYDVASEASIAAGGLLTYYDY